METSQVESKWSGESQATVESGGSQTQTPNDGVVVKAGRFSLRITKKPVPETPRGVLAE